MTDQRRVAKATVGAPSASGESSGANSDRTGWGLGLGAYLLWGLSPIFWKALGDLDATVAVAHRTVWTVVLLGVAHTVRRSWGSMRITAADPVNRRTFLLTAALLSVNWLIYVWAVNADRVVEASLGYFINPLVNVVLGVGVLGERLRRAQWVAVGIAAVGVGWLWARVGAVPWVALVLAGTFGLYGLLRKTAGYDSLEGLTGESAVMLVPAVLYLAVEWNGGAAIWADASLTDIALIMGTGLVTGTPLLLFAAAARRVPLSMMGLLQYLSPSLQLLLGVFAFGEDLGRDRLLGYVLVWVGLGVFAADSLRRRPTGRTASA